MHANHSIAVAVFVAVASTAADAQEIGRELNWQTPGSPNYQAPPQPTDQRSQLPSLSTSPDAAAPLSSGLRFFAKKIEVQGASALTAEEIAAVVRPHENRIVASADLLAIRLALSRLYITKGYVTSGVILPDQEVTKGVVVFRAIEGKLGAVQLEPDSSLRQRYIASRITRHLKQPLNVKDLQYALRVLQQDPNIRRLDARLSPGTDVGSSILRLGVEDEPRFQLGMSVDNHRASSTGAEHGTVFVGVRNLTGYGEELRASYGLSEGVDDGSAVLSIPLTARGVSFQAYYSQSNADIIEDRFEDLDIQSESSTWGGSLNLPLINGLNDTLSFSLGFESTSSQTQLLGLPFSFAIGAKDGKAETAAGLLGVDWIKRGASFATGLRLTYRRGLDALDATIYDPNSLEALYNPTRADGEFELYQAQATYILRLNAWEWFGAAHDRAQFVFRTTAQISQDPLLSLEKIAIGGVNSVRGYPENLLVRDNGVAATIELHVPTFRYRDAAHLLNLVFVPFIDYGRSWDDQDTDPGSDLRDSSEARHIWSAGLGLLWKPLHGLYVQTFWGADIGDNFDGDDPRQYREQDLQDDGFHFALTYIARW